MFKFTERPVTPEIPLKNMAFFGGNQPFACDVCANLDEINADMV